MRGKHFDSMELHRKPFLRFFRVGRCLASNSNILVYKKNKNIIVECDYNTDVNQPRKKIFNLPKQIDWVGVVFEAPQKGKSMRCFAKSTASQTFVMQTQNFEIDDLLEVVDTSNIRHIKRLTDEVMFIRTAHSKYVVVLI